MVLHSGQCKVLRRDSSRSMHVMQNWWPQPMVALVWRVVWVKLEESDSVMPQMAQRNKSVSSFAFDSIVVRFYLCLFVYLLCDV